MRALRRASAAVNRRVTSLLAQHWSSPPPPPSPPPSHTQLPHHAARLLLPPLQEVSRRGGSCVGAFTSSVGGVRLFSFLAAPTKSTTGVVTPFSFAFSSAGVVSPPSPSAAITGGVGGDFAAGGGGDALWPRIVRSESCASISRSTSLRWRTPSRCCGMIGGQQRRALSRSVALLAKMTGPITMSGGGGNWQKKVEKAEKACAKKEKTYEVTKEDLKRHCMKNPGDTTSDLYKMLQEWELTARVAYEAAQTQVEDAQGALAVAEELEKAEKTCEEKEKKYAVAQKKLEEHWAAHPGDTTSDQYKKLEEWELTARVAYEAAQTQVEDAQGALAVAEELEKAEKTCEEKEKKYAVAQKKLEEHWAAHPGDTTSDQYKKLEEWELTARVAYEEMTCAEKKKEGCRTDEAGSLRGGTPKRHHL